MRNPRVVAVTPNSDYTLVLTFTNGEQRVFDVKPYLDKGFFRELRDMGLFMSVKSVLGTVQWSGGQDFCPDTLYLDSVSVERIEPDARAERLVTVTHE